MAQYFYGAGTMACISGILSLANTHLPNDVYYWVDLMIPF